MCEFLVFVTEMLVDDVDDVIELQDEVALMQWISSMERQKRGLPAGFGILSAFLQRRHYRCKEWCCLQAAKVRCSCGVQNACNLMIGL